MKSEKIVINYGNGYSVICNDRAEAAQKIKHLLADYPFMTVENVSLKISEGDKLIKDREL